MSDKEIQEIPVVRGYAIVIPDTETQGYRWFVHWNIAAGTPLQTAPGHERHLACCFQKYSQALASCNALKTHPDFQGRHWSKMPYITEWFK